MLILLFLIFVGLIIAGYIYSASQAKNGNYYAGEALNIVGTIGAILVALVLVTCCSILSHGMVIDDKIKLYETENAKIDNQICSIVENYKDYEQSTFKDVKDKNANTLISLYPELKSDILAKEQIKIYNNNRKEILNLKRDELDYKPLRWWIYFGG